MSAAGGDARLFVSHPATVSRPLRSPDGTRLAFVSTRSGTGDIYILTLASGALQRLTVDDIPDTLGACSCDGRLVWFHPPSRDIAVLTGGAREVVLSADGKQVAFVARGVSV